MMIATRMLASSDAISRMTAGIVTGVGFIGGAVVLRDRANIYGVTTAATIWVRSLRAASMAALPTMKVTREE